VLFATPRAQTEAKSL